VELIGGGTPKTSKAEYWGGNINWLSVKDFNNENRYVYSTEKTITEEGLNNSSTKLLRKDDIIISARGTVGELAMIPFPMAFNQSCYGIRAKDGINSTFLYYLIKHSVRKLKAMTHGSVFDTITRDTFANIEVAIPDIETQQRVAKMLADIDDKVENNQRINNNLEQQAVLLFKKWFIEFDNSSKNMLETRFGLVPESFKLLKNGELPLVVTDYVANGSFASLKANVTLYQEPNYAYFIRNTDLKSGTFEVFVDEHSYNFLSKSTLYGGEIIISNVGDVGSVFLCPKLDKPMTLGNNIIMLRPEQENLRYYLYIWFKWLYGQSLIQGIKGGSAQPKFNKTDFKNLPIFLPPDDLLEQFHQIVKPMFELINENNTENQALTRTRDTILPRLMSGELDVSDIDL
jgi:type I restriction enzyme S subunit